MKFTIETKIKSAAFNRAEIVLLPVWLGTKNKPAVFGKLLSFLDKDDQGLVKKFITDGQRKPGTSKLLRLNKSPGFALVVMDSEYNARKLSLLVRQLIRTAKAEGFKEVALYADDFIVNGVGAEEFCALVSSNALYGHYDFSEQFKTAPVEGWRRVNSVTLFTNNDFKKCLGAVSRGEILGQSINNCQTLANYPPSNLNPEGMAEAARTVANEVKSVKVTVFDEKRLKQEGMNAILAVGAGSASPPRLIIMEYRGKPKEAKPGIALVGKGVTFDSGGLNLKPGDHMADMQMDMSGGAAVIYAIRAIAALKLPINVFGFIPAVENMPSGLSYRQGDIIKAYGGKTIEIGNTDAEGRVILADAIEYAKTKKPELIVEISTLTGAAQVALGQRMAALFVKNNRPLQDALQAIGEVSGDLVWPMPLFSEHEGDVEGNLADVTNTHKNSSRWGGAISAAAFLSKFAGTQPFAHIDMAPRMLTLPEEEQLSRGAAGFGVRLFVELAKQWSEIRKLA